LRTKSIPLPKQMLRLHRFRLWLLKNFHSFKKTLLSIFYTLLLLYYSICRDLITYSLAALVRPWALSAASQEVSTASMSSEWASVASIRPALSSPLASTSARPSLPAVFLMVAMCNRVAAHYPGLPVLWEVNFLLASSWARPRVLVTRSGHSGSSSSSTPYSAEVSLFQSFHQCCCQFLITNWVMCTGSAVRTYT
jgi:hypothetical protein